MPADRQPHPVDVHVGAQIRRLRKIGGVSQESLAEALGLTFQQVQKYEKGTNRVSSSKLYEIAGYLRRPVADFYPAPEGEVLTAVGDAELLQAAALLPEIALVAHLPRQARAALGGVIRAVAGACPVEELEDAPSSAPLQAASEARPC